MHLREAINKIQNHLENLTYTSTYDFEKKDTNNKANNLDKLREAIIELEDIHILDEEIKKLKNSSLFKTSKDEYYFTSSEDKLIKESISIIKNGFTFLKRMYYDNLASEDDLYIKLPEIENFDDLSKLSNELKKAVEIPINEQSKGHLKIKSAEPGSIWLLVSVGTFAAINLIGGICWAAAVIRKKHAEAKIFEQHAKTLELKNNALSSLIDAQNQQLDNILDSEAKQVMSNHYDSNNPEILAKLKLSITTVSNLIDRGTQILPASENNNVKNIFPDYSKLNLIESSIKMLKNNNDVI